MWIARDKDGSLWLSVNKPTKDPVQWEDEEPRELILKPIKY